MSQALQRRRRRVRQAKRFRKSMIGFAMAFNEILVDGIDAMFEVERQFSKDIQKAIIRS
jgi:hypothetical protein